MAWLKSVKVLIERDYGFGVGAGQGPGWLFEAVIGFEAAAGGAYRGIGGRRVSGALRRGRWSGGAEESTEIADDFIDVSGVPGEFQA